jgi:murein DD-endopeptidase MepM/ murein hydrolase activator NlpD
VFLGGCSADVTRFDFPVFALSDGSSGGSSVVDGSSSEAADYSYSENRLASLNPGAIRETNLSGISAPAPVLRAVPEIGQAATASETTIITVAPGDTIYGLSRRHGVGEDQLRQANGIEGNSIQVGQSLIIPSDTGEFTTAEARKVKAPPKPVKVARLTPSRSDAPTATGPKKIMPQPEPMASEKFRWPVRGRVISNFGSSTDGSHNDGINISVPVGTSVRAVENGVVAYAGNELKGYGNLILVRHADNWVSAYAYNSRLVVQRGDVISRGQIIAKSGNSGNAEHPQLHFELRKGAKPVNPIPYLSAV